jgi:hypothetical protein
MAVNCSKARPAREGCLGSERTGRTNLKFGKEKMAETEFETNLLRLIAAQIYFSLAMTAAREMFGRSYFSLGLPEKQAVDQALLGALAANYQSITPELLRGTMSDTKLGLQ